MVHFKKKNSITFFFLNLGWHFVYYSKYLNDKSTWDGFNIFFNVTGVVKNWKILKHIFKKLIKLKKLYSNLELHLTFFYDD